MTSEGVAEKISRWATLLLCGFLPFFFIPASWVSIPQAKILLVTILVVVATIAWIAAALSSGSIRLPKSPLLLAALLLPIAYLVSAVATGSSDISFVSGAAMQDTVVATMIWYALFVTCSLIFGGSVGKLVAGIRVLLLGGAVVLAIQMFHLLVPSFTFGGALEGQAASVVGSWHDLGIFIGLLLFLSIALISSPLAANRIWRFILIGIAAASTALLIIVNFKDVIIATGVLSLSYAAYLFLVSRNLHEGARRILRRRLILWAVVVVALTGLYFGGTFINSVLPTALQVTRLEVRPSWQGTYAVGSQAFTQPSTMFFGTGPNTFPREWGMHKPLSVNVTQFWNVDFYSGVGFIPTTFVTLGLLGVVAWAAVGLALLYSMWRIVRTRNEFSILNLLQAALLGGAVFLTAFHTMYVPGPALSALTFILFGAVVAGEVLLGITKDRTWSLSFGSWVGRIGALILTVFAFLVLLGGIQSSRAVVSEALLNRAVALYNASGDITAATNSVSSALKVWPENDRGHRAAVELGILQFAKLAESGTTDEASVAALQNTLSKTVEHGLTAVTIGGANYQNWLSLARLYGELAGAGVEGAEERARSAYEEAFKNNPTNPLPLLELAQMDLLKGDDAAAREHLTAALNMKPDLTVGLFLLSQIDARANDFAAALVSAEAVAQLAPSDALGWYNLGTIYYAQKNYTNSALAFERAVGIQNNYSNALYLLSASYAYLGRYEDAITALNAVIALNTSNTNLPPLVTALESGKNPFEGAATTTEE